jgi:CcmD family protein
MSEWYFVGAAYGLTWLGLTSFAIYLVQRRRRAQRRLAEVRSRIGGVS